MATMLGYSGGQLGRYERGEQKPTDIFYKVICEKYQVRKEYFEGSIELSEALSFPSQQQINWKAVGKRIKEIRNNMGMSQLQFAKYIGCAKVTILLVETGEKAVSDRLIVYICDFCDTGKDWVLLGDEKKKKYPVNDEMIHFLWENEGIREKIWNMMK